MPVRVSTLEKKSHDVMVRLQLPASRYVPATTQAEYIEFILRDGARALYSMANAPHTPPPRRCQIAHSAFAGGKFTDHVLAP